MLPNLISSQLMTCVESVESASEIIKNSSNVIFIGRGAPIFQIS